MTVPESPSDLPPKNPKQPPVWATVIAFVLLGGLLIILGWSLIHSQQGSVKVGDVIQPIEVNTFDGQKLNTGSDALKGKVLVINFWASWCGPCDSEAATLQQAWTEYAEGGQVQFIGIDYVDTEPEAKASIAKYGITYPNGPDTGTKISQYFRIQGVPETYIVDKNGKLAYIQVGAFESAAQIHKILTPIIGE
jgi:cytochrome c biogenesis protein CcmG/thiol:disulfide interchange protein DsbE